MINSGITICAITPEDDIAIALAKKYIKDNELTADDVGLYKSEGSVLVITKKEVELRV